MVRMINHDKYAGWADRQRGVKWCMTLNNSADIWSPRTGDTLLRNIFKYWPTDNFMADNFISDRQIFNFRNIFLETQTIKIFFNAVKMKPSCLQNILIYRLETVCVPIMIWLCMMWMTKESGNVNIFLCHAFIYL